MQGTLRVCKIGYTSTCHITCYSFLSNIAFARTTSFKSISSSTLQHSVYIHAALPQFLQCILISTWGCIGRLCQIIYSHRITQLFGLEGSFKSHLAQVPSNQQGHGRLHQIVQKPVWTDLECFQAWGIYHLCGNLQCFTTLIVKERKKKIIFCVIFILLFRI